MKPVSANYNISIIAISRYLWKALGIHFVKSWLTKIIQFSIHIMEIYKKSFNSWQHCIRQNGLVCQVFSQTYFLAEPRGRRKFDWKLRETGFFYKKFLQCFMKMFLLAINFFFQLLVFWNFFFFTNFSALTNLLM